MTKIKELLAGREKLKRYDELKATLNSLELIKAEFVKNDCDSYIASVAVNGKYQPHGLYLTPSAMDAIINALDAEIKKIDEE